MSFATEHEVRKQSFLDDFETVPSERLQRSLQQAHAEILLATVLNDGEPISGDVIKAEVLLTVSILFSATALSNTASARHLRASGVQLDEFYRSEKLQKTAAQLQEEAWGLLSPYLKNPSAPSLIKTGC